jgi:hypothetical protein
MSEKRKQYHSVPLRSHSVPARHTDEYERSTLTGQRRYLASHHMPPLPDEEQRHLPARLPNSTRRYTDAHGHEVFEQGNKRLVVHRKSMLHWLFFVGIGMLVAVPLFVGIQWLASSIQQHNTEAQYAQYGYPRTWQTDAVVGHGDSASHPSHFIFENLKGHVLVIELPGGDIARAIIYSGPTIYSNQADQLPVTGSFQDVNGDGRPDMQIHIDGQTITFLNNGTKFVAPSQ